MHTNHLSRAGLDPQKYAGMHSFYNGAATNAAQCGLNDATGHEVVGKKVPMIPTVQQTTEELEDNNFMPSQLCLVHVYPLLNYFMFWR